MFESRGSNIDKNTQGHRKTLLDFFDELESRSAGGQGSRECRGSALPNPTFRMSPFYFFLALQVPQPQGM